MRLNISSLIRRLVGLRRDRRGNVLMLFAFSLIPITFATGMTIDYSRAMRLQTKLNAAADAAALAAVGKFGMQLDQNTAAFAAYQMFIMQTQGLISTGELVINYYDPSQFTVDLSASTQDSRIVTVTYHAKSTNAFARLLGQNTLAINGTAKATSGMAPNIDFYMMLDTSQSMLLPATQSGLDTLTAATGGCAFACHQTQTKPSQASELVNNPVDPTDTSNPASDRRRLDNYQVARNNNIVLRTDLVTKAIQDLTSTAQQKAQDNKATYRMGLFSFDYRFQNIYPTTGDTTQPSKYYVTDMATANTKAANATVPIYCTNNIRVCGINDNDTNTDFTTAFNGSLASMPAKAGSGSKTDTPQAILFIITDGMRDEAVGGNVNARTMGPIPTSLCDSVKARGIRIAILDTQYLPSSASIPWAVTNVKTPFLSPTDRITPALQSCASSGLFYQVTTNDDISAALSSLFQTAIATAHLTK